MKERLKKSTLLKIVLIVIIMAVIYLAYYMVDSYAQEMYKQGVYDGASKMVKEQTQEDKVFFMEGEELRSMPLKERCKEMNFCS